MKYILSTFLALLLFVTGYSQGHETFENLAYGGTAYSDGDFDGQDGSTWEYLQSRGDIEINGETLTLGRNRSPAAKLTSGTINGGIGTMSFSYMQAFGSNVDLEVYVNNDLVFTATSSGEQDVVKNTGNFEVNVAGDVVIEFRQPNGAGQVAIDDIIWTAYTGGGGGGAACSDITIGEGGTATSSYIPIYYLYDYSYSQTIYTAAELQATGAGAGNINQIAYLPNANVSTADWRDWTIYMGNTTKDSFSGNSDWMGVAGNMQEVFSGDIPDDVVAGEWMEIDLDTSFAWDGTSNIVIAIVDNTDGWGGSPSWRGYAAGSDRGIYLYRDNNPIDVDAPGAGTGNSVTASIPQIKFCGDLLPNCADADAGVIDGPAISCPLTPFTLEAVGASDGETGLVRQWQSSSDGTAWTDIAGETNPTLIIEITDPTYFRYVVECDFGGSDTTATHFVDVNTNAEECYCVPQGTNSNYYIDDFSTTGGGENISNMGSGFSPGGYGNFYDTHTVQQDLGGTVDFEMAGPSTFGFRIWVDWNQDGIFDSSEVVWNSNGYSGTHSGGFTVPVDAVEGETRMRIANHWLSNTGNIDPCATNHTYGEFEDYKFIVGDGGGGGSSSCSDITIGEGGTATSSWIPIYYLYDYSYSQAIYTAAELQATGAGAGDITQIAYLPNNSTTTENWRNWTIYMSNTTESEFAGNSGWLPVTGSMQEVFSGDILDDVVAGEWMEIDLDTSFAWDGTSNIVIAVIDNTDGWGGSPSWRGYTAGDNRGIFVYRDNTPYDVDNPGTANGTTAFLPMIKFCGDLFPNCADADAGVIDGPAISCPLTPFTLEAVGASNGEAGLVRQWQSSPDGTAWTDIAGETNPTLITEITDPTYFRYVVECDFGGSDTTAAHFVDVNTNAEECYCVPQGTNSNYYIDDFSTTGGGENISNMGSGFSPGGYGDFYDTHTVQQDIGETVDFEMAGPSTFGFRIWVDWNQDGIFDSSEVVWNSNGYSSTHSGDFTVPADAVEGETRMRIVNHWLNSSGDIDPCATGHTYGEFEDYKFIVGDGGGGNFPDPYCDWDSAFDIEPITYVQFAGIDNESDNTVNGSPALEDFTHIQGTVELGGNYVIGLNGNTNGIWENNFAVFIDWNQDGDFDDPDEFYFIGTIEDSDGLGGPLLFGNIIVPEDATVGQTRMRVIKDYDPIVGACDGAWFGQAEDYTLNVEENDEPTDYCIPEGVTATRYINNFSTTGGGINISNMSTGFSPGGYGDFYSSHSVSQEPGEEVSFEVDIEGGTAGFRIWVDWNQDGVFDTTEEVAWNSNGYQNSHSGTFEVPLNALPGDTRMRIVSHWLSTTGDVDPCATGFTYGEFEDYKFMVGELEDCDGTPDAGTVSVNPEEGSVGSAYIVSSTGYTTGSGLTYQWQSNTNGAGWVDEGAATTVYQSFNATAPGEVGDTVDWQLIVICTLSGESDTSNTATFTVDSLYCTPEGTNPSYYINDFFTTGGLINISNMGSGFSPGGYGNFYNTHEVAQVPGESVNFTANFPSTYGFRIWVDWNQDGIFDTNEEVVWNSSSYASSHTGSFDVPFSAIPGETRMRIVNHWLNTGGDVDPCATNHTYGEFEDYKFTVIELEDCDGTPDAGTVSVTPEGGSAGSAYTVSSTGYTIGNGLTYQWQSNTNSAGWVNEGAATDSYVSVEAIAPGDLGDTVDWQLIVTCTLSGESDTSNTATFTVDSLYCTPEGTNPSYYINDFYTTGGIINISNMDSGFSPGGYGNFYNTHEVSQLHGESVNFTANFPSGQTYGFRIWVDWNQDGVFDASEEVAWNSTSYSNSHSGSFSVPFSAVPGETRMRIVGHWLNSQGEIDPCATGHTYGEFEDYKFIVGELEDCSGVPDGGEVTVTPNQGNVGSTYTVSATGFSIGNDMSYQWQSNTAGAGWVDEGAATAFYESYTATAPGDLGVTVEWRLEVTCTNSGETSYSDTDTFTTIIDYCVPSISTVEPITRVVFAGIDNMSSAAPSSPPYEDFTSVEGEVEAGMAYDFAAEGYTGGNYTNYFTVWIDWNGNGEFEPSEMTEIGSISNSTGTDGQQATNVISVPADAQDGNVRMRVIKNYFSSPTNPCGSYSFGQVEDYTIIVGEGEPQWPIDCQQLFDDGEADAGIGFSGDNRVANDVIVPVGSSFTVQTLTFEMVALDGEPTNLSLEVFNGDGAGGVGTSTGTVVDFDNSNMTFTPNGLLFDAYPQYTVELTMPGNGLLLNGDADDDLFYWLALDSEVSTTGDFTFWVAYPYTANPTSPTWQYTPADGWFEYADSSGGVKEGFMHVEGICDTLETDTIMSKFDFTYYPNPVKDVLYINSSKKVESVQVYNLAGQEVMKQTKQLSTANQIDVTALSNGVYVFRAVLEGGVVETFRVIKK